MPSSITDALTTAAAAAAARRANATPAFVRIVGPGNVAFGILYPEDSKVLALRDREDQGAVLVTLKELQNRKCVITPIPPGGAVYPGHANVNIQCATLLDPETNKRIPVLIHGGTLNFRTPSGPRKIAASFALGEGSIIASRLQPGYAW